MPTEQTEAERKAAREMLRALEPFVKACDLYAWPTYELDARTLAPDTTVNVGHLRTARAAFVAAKAAGIGE